MYIDTHAHLTFPQYNLDVAETIKRAKEAKLIAIIDIALDEEAIKQSFRIAEDYPDFVYNAIGVHPHDASGWQEDTYEKLKEFTKKKRVVAIGEMGLDYHYKLSPIDKQQAVFRKLLKLAQELNLPAVIHSRDAARDTIKIIREEHKGNLKAVLHCFGGGMELTQGALELGLIFSFTGNITFPKADQIRAAAKELPLEKIMIETDCPFMAPQVYRGKRNEPAYVVHVAEEIAKVKGISIEEVAEATTANAKSFFNI